MGVVKKQATTNAFISYIGIALGYVNTVLLFPNIFTEAQFGLTRVLIAISAIYIQLASMGVPKIALRFFPFFKDNEQRHNGFFILLMFIATAGFLLATVVFFLVKEALLDYYARQSGLLKDYLYLVVPLSFFMLYFLVLESYFQAKLQTVVSVFLRNVFLRLVWTGEIALFYFKIIDFNQFIWLFVFAYFFNACILQILLIVQGDLMWSINKKYFNRRWFKHIFTYGLFSVLGNFSMLLVTRIDVIMIGFMIGLEAAAVYSIAMYFSSVINVPAQSVLRISAPLVALRMKEKNYEEVNKLYMQTSLNNFFAGAVVFTFIFILLPEAYSFLPQSYHHIEWVFVFLGLARMVDMIGGVNGLIIVNSKYYKIDVLFSVLLAASVIVFNLVFIKIYGIEGAALSSFIAFGIFNFSKIFFLKKKINLFPFSKQTIVAVLFMLLVNIIFKTIISGENWSLYQSVAIKSVILVVVFLASIFYLPFAKDFKVLIINLLNKSKKK